MIVLAISPKKTPFIYNYKTAHKVSKASAATICSELNKTGYQLRPGEKWTVYSDISQEYDNAGIMASGQAFKVYRGSIRRVAYGPFSRH